MRVLFLLFVIMPILEMVVLIKVGSSIGALYTIALVLLTAVVGVALLRQQGLRTLLHANQKMRSGQMPVEEIGEGLMLAVAGALLLTPGFVTDSIGFLLLTPGVRQRLAHKIAEKLVASGSGALGQGGFYSSSESTYSQSRGGDVINGEFQDVSDDKPGIEK